MTALKISLEKVRKGPTDLRLSQSCDEIEDMADLQCLGEVRVSLQCTPAREKLILRGHFSGEKVFECRYCGSSRRGCYKLPLHILVEPMEAAGIRWNEEAAQHFDDYYVSVGPDTPSLAIDPVLREQLALASEPTSYGQGIALEACRQCAGMDWRSLSHSDYDSVDPRWEKLKSLKK